MTRALCPRRRVGRSPASTACPCRGPRGSGAPPDRAAWDPGLPDARAPGPAPGHRCSSRGGTSPTSAPAGSEVLVDRLASGMLARGHRVTLLAAGRWPSDRYRVVRNGGTYSQFLRAPFAYRRHFGNADLVVEVCNGMPFLRRCGPGARCSAWSTTCTPTCGRCGSRPRSRRSAGTSSSRLMPWVHRRNLFLTVSDSTAAGAAGDRGRRRTGSGRSATGWSSRIR